MKKLLILSGKGGTGKTTVAASLIELFGAKAFADCDVDAPNLHLVESRSATPEVKDFYGSQKAIIDKARCTFCGACASNCRFDAIKLVKSQYRVDEYSCEGCGVCNFFFTERNDLFCFFRRNIIFIDADCRRNIKAIHRVQYPFHI